MDLFKYPLNIFTPDPLSESERPYITFVAKEIKFDVASANSWIEGYTNFEAKKAFVLPMPNNGLKDTLSNNYDGNASFMGGEAAKKAASAINGVATAGTLGMVSNAVEKAGYVPDPKLTQVYMGTSPRSWTGNWQLVPQNALEAQAIADILKIIKESAAPAKGGGDKVGYLTPPYVFTIAFSNPIIEDSMKFETMALTSYSIDYFAQGYASTYDDMMPKQISLEMNFSEFGIKTREDWE